MIDRLSYVTVLVDDQSAAEEFYTETFGLAVREDRPLPDGGRWLTVGVPGQAFPRFLLADADREHPRLPDDSECKRARVGSQTGDYVAFVFDVDDCRETVSTLRERGLTVVGEPERVPWGVEAAVRDPWGNVYELVEHAEG